MQTIEIKEGIHLHTIKNNKFKTDLTAVFITFPLDRKHVTTDALIPCILRRGTSYMATQDEISKHLEEQYGASFDCGVEKVGDNHVIKLYIESVNDNFLPEQDNLIKKVIDTMFQIILDPLLEQGKFKEDYVTGEKNNLRRIIESKIDNKEQYAVDGLIQTMYKDMPYGLYKYGYIDDLEKISNDDIYNRYLELLKIAKFDVYISGDFDENRILDTVQENMKKLEGRIPQFVINNEETETKELVQDITETVEHLNVSQGKLIIGLDVLNTIKNSRFAISLYNVIMGESPTSKLFQNVREKASLAYVARSTYLRQKSNIFIKCGIEIENYKKAVEIIKEQLETMKNGEFSEDDIEVAKKYMVNGIKTVEEEQDAQITYYIGQELSGYNLSLEEYKENISKITKEDIVNIAKNVQINSIYFLRD